MNKIRIVGVIFLIVGLVLTFFLRHTEVYFFEWKTGGTESSGTSSASDRHDGSTGEPASMRSGSRRA